MKVSTNYDCSYVDCKYTTLAIIQYCDTTCDNWFHRLCKNKYDSSKYFNEFDTICGVKKRCKKCVNKMMQKFENSFNKSSVCYHLLLANDN